MWASKSGLPLILMPSGLAAVAVLADFAPASPTVVDMLIAGYGRSWEMRVVRVL